MEHNRSLIGTVACILAVFCLRGQLPGIWRVAWPESRP